ncbi:1-acyl-sn-glycerol-3-phosphate acyltransferase [Algibacter lectus]|uniref:1-acyl-sn-glycerol-3-phosphate acyltransferase n=1 Tax=Algibacter lectus TaxID=221126 RepID=A0A4R8MDK9_9FLAO|nr:1-acyl-sn-glycerol-3-phosphate acyltransferase [Algibacter lectus]MWW23443.1 acyltransferase [Algibacter lectus]TDY63880.1 1-acyl-sn-glycerol-3-phosphate acyltransferase [Algibacter lectus]SFC25097.1 1-acyl-sn-glycerol-3-phosphate acyltransferases [Algibacter lectus]
MQWLAKVIYFKVLGWQIVGNTNFSKDTVKKAVIIAAPHTSWHDFYIGVLLRAVIQVKTNFVGKKELFVFPVAWFFRALGGAPINRQNNENKVDAIAKLFKEKEEFRMTLAPEGTRKKVDQWRTGFYYIAKQANVPIIMFTLDFENKQNKISEPFYPTDNAEADFEELRAFFKDVKGKVSKYS